MQFHKPKLISLAFSALAAVSLGAGAPKKGPKPAVTLEQAQKAAAAAVPDGKVTHGVYEFEAGKWIYDFDISTPSTPEGVREIWVDPQSGKVIHNEAKSKADQLADRKAAERAETPAQERAEAAKAKKPAFTLAQARQTALSAVPGGKVKSGEYEKEGGQWIYSFDITTAKGIREVWVDPQSGKVIKNEAESKAHEKVEAVQEHSEAKH